MESIHQEGGSYVWYSCCIFLLFFLSLCLSYLILQAANGQVRKVDEIFRFAELVCVSNKPVFLLSLFSLSLSLSLFLSFHFLFYLREKQKLKDEIHFNYPIVALYSSDQYRQQQ